MLLALVIVLVVAHAPDARTAADVRAAVETAVPAGSVVTLRDDGSSVDGGAPTDVVATIAWRSARTAAVSVRDVRTGREESREITFGADEDVTERARAAGFLVASIASALSESTPRDAATAPAASVATPQAEQPRAPPVPTAPVGETRREDAIDLAPRPVAIVALGTVFVAGPVALGGDLAARWRFAPDVELRGTAGVAFGELPSADASLRVVRLRAGGDRVVVSLAQRRVELLAAVDLGATGLTAERRATPGADTRWTFVGDAVLEARWRFANPIVAVVEGGGEVAVRPTRVFIGNDSPASIAAVRASASLGLGLLF